METKIQEQAAEGFLSALRSYRDQLVNFSRKEGFMEILTSGDAAVEFIKSFKELRKYRDELQKCSAGVSGDPVLSRYLMVMAGKSQKCMDVLEPTLVDVMNCILRVSRLMTEKGEDEVMAIIDRDYEACHKVALQWIDVAESLVEEVSDQHYAGNIAFVDFDLDVLAER